eukprot:10166920-Alexandrium_andersonii.AAC.1
MAFLLRVQTRALASDSTPLAPSSCGICRLSVLCSGLKPWPLLVCLQHRGRSSKMGLARGVRANCWSKIGGKRTAQLIW